MSRSTTISTTRYFSVGSITKKNFDRIKYGMSMEEVEAILGKPRFIPQWNLHRWLRDDGAFTLIRFIDNMVSFKTWEDSTESILETFRRWLRL